jgi:hypothetical protein
VLARRNRSQTVPKVWQSVGVFAGHLSAVVNGGSVEAGAGIAHARGSLFLSAVVNGGSVEAKSR